LDSLLSAIEEIPVRVEGPVPSAALGEDIAVLGRAMSMLVARLAGRIASQRALGPHPDGLSLTRWVAVHADLSDGEARSLVGLAETAVSHPRTAEALESGSLSHSRARMLSRVAQSHPKLYERDEPMLLDFAGNLELKDLRRSIRYWANCADDSQAERAADRRRDLSHLHASVTYSGMVRLDGLLDPETGEAVLTALDAACPPPLATDSRSVANRRAEALGQVCEQWLRNGTIDGGLRAAVSLSVDLDTLEGRPGRRSDLDHTGPVTPETAKRILCDADVTRVITRGASEVLDLGRSTRVPSPALRKAMVARDQGCRFRGCDRPAVWCDVHHIVHWLNGGETSLENCLLLCRYHHTFVHRGGAVIIGNDVIPTNLVAADTARVPP
jgi:Domain of unknown function (DUF222)/HNH endonuclease